MWAPIIIIIIRRLSIQQNIIFFLVKFKPVSIHKMTASTRKILSCPTKVIFFLGKSLRRVRAEEKERSNQRAGVARRR